MLPHSHCIIVLTTAVVAHPITNCVYMSITSIYSDTGILLSANSADKTATFDGAVSVTMQVQYCYATIAVVAADTVNATITAASVLVLLPPLFFTPPLLLYCRCFDVT